jgi:hypothetical protein
MAEMIVAAALQLDGVTRSMPAPARHHTILHAIDAQGYSPETMARMVQGFLTSEGRFVGRREATSIAVIAEQIQNPKWPPDLYSEDLW